jgi:NAD(P)-dependent dehydrogenase (short-subunit alcohol dehydrogenase family)
MTSTRKTAIVTGASQGIGAGVAKAFVERGYNVVANSLKVTKSTEVAASERVALVEGDIGDPTTAAAPGAVYTPLHRNTPKDVMESLSPMGRPSTVQDITDAVLYLTDAATVTGHILYVDGGAHFGRW